MNPTSDSQLDLLALAEHAVPASDARGLLGVLLDQRSWLSLLSEEWLQPEGGGPLVLGNEQLVAHTSFKDGLGVSVWFDPLRLPSVPVQVFKGGTWATCGLSSINGDFEALAWDGPLPLFAVERFCAASITERAHLIALAQGFADLELPVQEITVEQPKVMAFPIIIPESRVAAARPPGNWNALRGAAAMASWSVPTIDPWLDLLCDSLQSERMSGAAELLKAPWWFNPLWASNEYIADQMWRAVLEELNEVRSGRKLQPKAFLAAVCARAETLGCESSRVDQLWVQTNRLLNDEGTIESEGIGDDVLLLALQLFLLRPDPERFVGWREDWPAMPPGAWWTGATLTGFVCGFRALPPHFRGSPAARKILALRTWRLSKPDGENPWASVATERLTWARDQDFIVFRSNSEVWAEHKISRRGRWYQLDYSNEDIRCKAESLVRALRPDLLAARVILENVQLPIQGGGLLRINDNMGVVEVSGYVEIELQHSGQFRMEFSERRFKEWLATASISMAIPPPTFVKRPANDVSLDEIRLENPTRSNREAAQVPPTMAPDGLRIVEDFIDPAEEEYLLREIDAQSWDTRMSRHVQHYGWQYDYKARKIDPKSYLGPLPDWLQMLAQRLVDRGIFNELPDQVIVNNYIGSQSISKHVDCIPCFRGPIVTISLMESWEMVFAPVNATEADRKFKQILSRRSAVVLDGESRRSWTHEIPRRLKEGKMTRGRRVSITFRKVDVDHTEVAS